MLQAQRAAQRRRFKIEVPADANPAQLYPFAVNMPSVLDKQMSQNRSPDGSA